MRLSVCLFVLSVAGSAAAFAVCGAHAHTKPQLKPRLNPTELMSLREPLIGDDLVVNRGTAAASTLAMGYWMVLGTFFVSLSVIHADSLKRDLPLVFLLGVAAIAAAEAAPSMFGPKQNSPAADACVLVDDLTYVACLDKPDGLDCEMDWSTLPPSWLCKV